MSNLPVEIWKNIIAHVPVRGLPLIRQLNVSFLQLSTEELGNRISNNPGSLRITLRDAWGTKPTQYSQYSCAQYFCASLNVREQTATLIVIPQMQPGFESFAQRFDEGRFVDIVDHKDAARILHGDGPATFRGDYERLIKELVDKKHGGEGLLKKQLTTYCVALVLSETENTALSNDWDGYEMWKSSTLTTYDDSSPHIMDARGNRLIQLSVPIHPKQVGSTTEISVIKASHGNIEADVVWESWFRINRCVGLRLSLPLWTTIRLMLT